MRIGVPTEVKNRETRVALTAHGAGVLTSAGHTVTVQAGAGAGSFISDADYERAGAQIVSRDEAWSADLVVKVKEPVPDEHELLRDNVLFTFLHLAANEPLARALIGAGTTALSYDTVQTEDGRLPLLAPMSAVAGRLAIVAGGYHLLSPGGGRGVLLGGTPDVPGARVLVIGAGVAGSEALRHAVALGADAVVADVSTSRLEQLTAEYGQRVRTVVSTPEALAAEVAAADLVVGAVLVPGRAAPHVVTHDQVMGMREGSVLVDIAIDQGGCFEDSRPTTHDDPVYRVGPALMYCVANMPGAVGATATAALTTATLPYVEQLAQGWERAVSANRALARGLNVCAGELRHGAIAQAFSHLPARAA